MPYAMRFRGGQVHSANVATERDIPPSSSRREQVLSPKAGWVLAIALGLAGFVANSFAISSGWGLEFILGGAIVFSALRVLTPLQIAVAGSIAASQSIWLWDHPWAWVVWTVEAAIIGSLSKRTSPIRHDVLFWLVLGAPLLWLTYGAIMKTDGSSLTLVILKHSINGVLNVTLGELIYTGALLARGQRSAVPMPPVSIDSAILAIMVSVATLPTVIWLRVDAPQREMWLRSMAQAQLVEGYQDIERKLWSWREERTRWLDNYAFYPAIPLHSEFASVQFMQRSERMLRPLNGAGPAIGPITNGTLPQPQLLFTKSQGSGVPKLLLAEPGAGNRANIYAVATLQPDVFEKLLAPTSPNPGYSGVLLVGPTGEIGARFGNVNEPWLQEAAARAFPDGRTIDAQAPREFGTAPMNASRDLAFVTARPTRAFSGWKVVLISQARNAVLEQREAQIRTLLALAGLILLLTLIATVVANRSRRFLEHMAQSLTDLAFLGEERDQAKRVLIAEMEDISERINAASSRMLEQRKALLANRRRLEIILEHGGLVIYTIDTTDPKRPKLKSITPNVRALSGYTTEEMPEPKLLPEYLHPDDKNEPPVMGDLQPGSVITREYRIRNKAGHYIWLHDCLVVNDVTDANPNEAVGFIIDISNRKAASEKLIQASKMESLGRMAAGVAHELNQPLNFISLASQNLYKRFAAGKLDATYAADKIERILSQVRRAAMIVGQVRTFGRSEAETSEVIPVKDVVADVVSLLKGQLDLKGVTLRSEPISQSMCARIHPVRLGQVLINLVINARDSILQRREEGSTPGNITISVRRSRDWVEIAVEDTGTGIPQDKLALLFEPFFTTKSPQEGTGLGLSVSYGIIADVGGTIRAENVENGARFTICLPVPEPEMQAVG